MVDRMIWWTSGMGAVEIRIPEDAIGACSHPGPCDDDVAANVGRVDWQRGDADAIRRELREYGAWDAEELADDEQNRHRILWLAAGDLSDQPEEEWNASDPVEPAQ